MRFIDLSVLVVMYLFLTVLVYVIGQSAFHSFL